MRIDTLRMKNFRPYLGSHSYDFATPAKSNLIIIFGENMSGKTALFTAIRWCLYGRAFDRQEQPIPVFLREGGEQLLNTIAATNEDFNLEAELDFVHGGQKFELRRVSVGTEDASGEIAFESDVFLKIDGERIADSVIEVHIGNVLHEDIARFSLFDGEMLNDYEKLLKDSHAEGEAIKEAIEKILGLPALRRGAECLDAIAVENERELNRHVKKEQKHQEALQLRDRLENERGSKKRELATLQASAAKVASELEEVTKDLGEQREVDRLISQASSLESEIDSAKDRRTEHIDAIKAALDQSWWVALAGSVREKLTEFDEAIGRESERMQDDLVGALLARSLDGDNCEICGEAIPEHAAEMMRSRLALRTGHEGTSDGSLLSRLQEYRKYLGGLRVDRSAERVASATREIVSLDSEILTKDQKWRAVKEEMTRYTKGDAEKKAHRYAQLESRSRELGKHIEDARARIADLSERIDAQQKIINRFVGAGDTTRRKTELARLSERAFSRAIRGFRESARERVGAEADAIFKRLTTEQRYEGLAINSNYGLVIRDSNGNQIPGASAGAGHIVALSLIGGLNRAAVSGDAPLVMDTNFGRLDKTHRKNVLKYVESLEQQVILLVHSGELDPDELSSFDVRCGRRYRIERKSEWESQLEVDLV